MSTVGVRRVCGLTVVSDPRFLCSTSATLGSSAVDLAVTQGPLAGIAVCVLGVAPLYGPLTGALGAGTLLVAPWPHAVLLAATLDGNGAWTQRIPLPPSVRLPLINQTVLATAVAFDNGELRAGGADLVRF